MRRYKVYVAGAYSDTDVLRVLRNIGRGQFWAAQLFHRYDFAPFVPWFDKEFVFASWEDEFEVTPFYEYSMEWLRVSDAVFVVPNHVGMKKWEDSVGVKKEIKEAEDNNIPVFYDLDSLLRWRDIRSELDKSKFDI